MNIRDVIEHMAKVKSLSGPSQPAKMVLHGERDGVPNHGHRNESLEPKGRAPHSPCWDVGGSNNTHWVDVTGMCKTFSKHDSCGTKKSDVIACSDASAFSPTSNERQGSRDPHLDPQASWAL